MSRVRWWGRRWLQTVQSLGCVERISRGREYAKAGRVLEHAVSSGRITAQVQGSQQPSYDVRFEAETLDPLQWKRVLDVLGGRPLCAARLLAGEVPEDVEMVFSEAGVSLLPSEDLTAHCSCASEERSCKHIAAASYVIADAMEEDPFNLFTFRGQPRSQLVAALRGSEGTALAVDARSFWTAAPLDRLKLDLIPRARAAPLMRLGALPWCDVETLLDVLGPAYDAVAENASRVIGP